MTGRADLLRLLAVAPRDTVVLEHDASGWIGYVRRPPLLVVTAPPSVDYDLPSDPLVRTTSKVERPLELSFLHMVVRRQGAPRAT
jgi:hypothetical protein